MNVQLPENLRLGVLCHSSARAAQRSDFSSQIRDTIRYADPAAWTIAAAVQKAMNSAPVSWADHNNRVGLVLVGARGPKDATRAVMSTVPHGYVSPLHFAAAGPGALLAVACIALCLRGPTLNLTVPVERGVPIGGLVAYHWLRDGVTKYVFLVTWCPDDEGMANAYCVLVTNDLSRVSPACACTLVEISKYLVQPEPHEG